MTDMMTTLRGRLPSANDVLHQVGLEREHPATSMPTAMAVFALGAVTGAVLAVLFIPRMRRAIRQTMRERLQSSRERVATANGDNGARSSGAATHWPEGIATRP
jgi:hypothetical protein